MRAPVRIALSYHPISVQPCRWVRPCLSKNFLDFNTVIFSFLFDKHYPIVEQLGLKDSSRDLQINGIISYLFYLYLMFHTYTAIFDVMENLVKFWVFGCTKQGLSLDKINLKLSRQVAVLRASFFT